jgi:hypothetical protein
MSRRRRRRLLSQPPPPGSPGTDLTPAPPGHHTELADLPQEVADQLAFEVAAPAGLRKGKRYPPEVRTLMSEIWDGIVADVYVELVNEAAKGKKRGHFNRTTIRRIMGRVSDRLHRSQAALIVAGVYYPAPGGPGAQAVAAGAAGGALAGIEEVVAYTSAGPAAAAAVTAAMISELLDTYLAASARTRQYQKWGRSPSAELIATELARARGAEFTTNKASRASMRALLRRMGDDLVRRTGARFFRGLIPAVGIGINAVVSGRDVQRIAKLEPAPIDAEEAERLRDHAPSPPYDESMRSILELADPDQNAISG